MHYSKNEIIDAVKRVLEERMPVQKSAKLLGMSKATLYMYVERARIHGYKCLARSVKNRKFDGKFKLSVIEFKRENHLSNYLVAAHFNLSKSMIQNWERIYLTEGPIALYKERRGRKKLNKKQRVNTQNLENQTKEKLIEENKNLRMENDFLKKLNALVLKREKLNEKK